MSRCYPSVIGQLQSKSEEIQSLSKAKNSLDEQFETYRKQEGSSIISVRKFEEKLQAEEKHVQFLEAEVCVHIPCLQRTTLLVLVLNSSKGRA